MLPAPWWSPVTRGSLSITGVEERPSILPSRYLVTASLSAPESLSPKHMTPVLTETIKHSATCCIIVTIRMDLCFVLWKCFLVSNLSPSTLASTTC